MGAFAAKGPSAWLVRGCPAAVSRCERLATTQGESRRRTPLYLGVAGRMSPRLPQRRAGLEG